MTYTEREPRSEMIFLDSLLAIQLATVEHYKLINHQLYEECTNEESENY